MPPTPSFPSADVNPIRGVNKVCSSCKWGGVGRRGGGSGRGCSPSPLLYLHPPFPYLAPLGCPQTRQWGGLPRGAGALSLRLLHPPWLSASWTSQCGQGRWGVLSPPPALPPRRGAREGGVWWLEDRGRGGEKGSPAQGTRLGSGAAGEAEAEAKGGDLGPSSGWPCPGAVHSLSPTPSFLSLPSPSFISCTPQKVNPKGRKITSRGEERHAPHPLTSL